MIDYKTLLELVEKYDEEVRRIFDKLQEVDLEAKAGVRYDSDYDEDVMKAWKNHKLYSDEEVMNLWNDYKVIHKYA